MASLAFHTHPSITLVATITLAGATDGTVTNVFTAIPKKFRVETARVVFSDLGSAQTADIGFDGGDDFFDGIDTGTAGGSATYGASTEAGVLNTTDGAAITFKNIGAAATGTVRLEVTGRMDYSV